MGRLNLGCGDYYAEGWVNVDIASNGRVRPDIVHDLSAGIPFDGDRFDRVYMGHFIEHLALGQVVPILSEVRRVLRPGGEACIVGPDVGNTLRLELKTMVNVVLYGGNRWDGDRHLWTSTGEAHLFAAQVAGFTADLVDIADVPEEWPVASRAPWQFAVMLEVAK